MMSFNNKTFIKSLLRSPFRQISTLTLSSLLFVNSAFAQQATNLDELLSRLETGQIAQTKQNQAREQEFTLKVNEQGRLLNQAKAARDQAINTSTSLEANFQDNEVKLGNKTEA